MSASGPEDALLPQIDHLTVDQLLRRATSHREDANLLDPQKCPGAIRMLLADAERCESLATSRKATQQLPIDGLARLDAGAEIELLARALSGCSALSKRGRGRAWASP